MGQVIIWYVVGVVGVVLCSVVLRCGLALCLHESGHEHDPMCTGTYFLVGGRAYGTPSCFAHHMYSPVIWYHHRRHHHRHHRHHFSCHVLSRHIVFCTCAHLCPVM